MADEIARLGVAVDSSSAVSAERDLEALAAAGDHATASTQKLSGAWQSATFTPTQLYSANRALADFRAKAREASAAVDQVDNSWKKATFSDRQLYSANQSLNRFKQELQQARTASTQLSTANKVQAASHHQVAKAAAGYTKSAKELAFATRNLPAQFTDIAVSLQAGQNPLTVLLQQGGQLKDMFGGVGQAARAMGSYVMGLINVWTVGAAAVAALGIAWFKGDNEARKFNQTLIMQGESLGVTTDSLMSAAEGMTRFGQTQGAAADALNQTAASGKIFGDSIQTVAQAALNMERVAGQSIEKTVEEFASLGDDPVAAAIELDEKYHFLTTSVYEQIKALQEQGDIIGATKVAQDSLADTIDERSAEIDQNLGYVQKRWRELAGAAKFAWDAMLDIGRQDTFDERISDLNARLARAKKIVENPPGGRFGAEQLAQARAELRNVKREFDQITEEATDAAQESRRKRDTRIAAENARALDQEAARYAENSEKRRIKIAKINETARLAIEAEERLQGDQMVENIRRIREDQAAAIAGVEKALADPKQKKSQAARDAEKLLRERARDYANLDQALDRHAETLAAAGDAQDNLTAFEKFAIKTISDLDNGHTALDLAQRQEIKNRIESLRVLDQENEARKKQEKIMEVSANLHARIGQELSRQGQSHGREMLGIGRGQNEGALVQALEDIRIRSLEERVRLEKEYQKLNSVGSAQYLEDLAAINEAEARLVNNEIAQMERRKEAMGDWRNGARAAMEDIAWEMGDVAGRTRDSFMTAFSAMNSALTTFANTGKLKIRDFATVVIAELLRIALTIAASKILQSFLGVATDSSVNLGGSTYGASNTYAGGVAVANGAAFTGTGQLIPMARGGLPFAGRGGVRTSPTLSTMANGSTVLMAEQQPEAVMPLARGPNGKLGVLSQGRGGTVMNVSTEVHVHNDGTSTSVTRAEGDDARDGKVIASLIDKKVREVLTDEMRQGGTLWAMQNGR